MVAIRGSPFFAANLGFRLSVTVVSRLVRIKRPPVFGVPQKTRAFEDFQKSCQYGFDHQTPLEFGARGSGATVANCGYYHVFRLSKSMRGL